MAKNAAKTMTITLRLLQDSFEIEDALKEDHELIQCPCDILDSKLYAGKVYRNAPGWAGFLKNTSSDFPDLTNEGSAAVLFLPVDNRIMAVCFGHVQMKMNLDSFERDFGLRVVLNAVSRSGIRSLDCATPDAVTFQRRVQASQNSDIGLFELNYDRDLLTLVSGTPSDTRFAKFLNGKDRLQIRCFLTPQTIVEKCEEVLEAYEATDYQTDYGWIDNIRPVKDLKTIGRLDLKLNREIKKIILGKDSCLHMSPPEIVDYEDGKRLKYNGFGSHGTQFETLCIDDYAAELERTKFTGDISDIKKHRVLAQRGDSDEFSEKWKVYDCFVLEVSFKKNHYVLWAGQWYLISRGFSEGIDKFFKGIETVEVIKSTYCRNEKELIKYLEDNRSDLVKLDCSKINPSGERYANLEPCDFFSKEKQFIHIKDDGASSKTSHLWMQGVVSCEAFSADKKYRGELRDKVKSIKSGFAKLLPESTETPNPADYQIVFAIMRKPYIDGTLGIPFFSKVALKTATERIRTLGYSVAINLIEKK